MGKLIGSGLEVRNLTSPTQPAAGHTLIYPKGPNQWYSKDSGGNEVPISGTSPFGSSAPSSPVIGQTWFDSAAGALKIWNGINWQLTDTQVHVGTEPGVKWGGRVWYDIQEAALKVWDSANSVWRRTFSELQFGSEPNYKWSGLLWFDPTSPKLRLWNGISSTWVEIGGGGGSEVVIDDAEPAGASDGTLWYDEDEVGGVQTPVRCRVVQSVQQNMVANWNRMTFSSGDDVIDTHNAFDPSTGVYTVPVGGYYDVSYYVQTGNAGATAVRRLIQLETWTGAAPAVGFGTIMAREDVTSTSYWAGSITTIDQPLDVGANIAVGFYTSLAQGITGGILSIRRHG